MPPRSSATTRITTDRLQEVVERGLADPQAAAAARRRTARRFQRQTLSRLINRQVLAAAAEREGVTVADGDVDAQLEDFAEQAGGREALEAQAAQNGIAPEDLPASCATSCSSRRSATS